MARRSAGVPGLIFTPQLWAADITSVDATFEPSLGIMAAKVNKLGLNIRSFRVPLERCVREVVIPSIQMNFHKQGRPAWDPLSEDTIAQRQGNGFDLRILDRTGALKKVMGQMNIWHIDTQKAFIANLPNKVWYGVVHQGGFEGGRTVSRTGKASSVGFGNLVKSVTITEKLGAIPARPFVQLQKNEYELLDEVFLQWLDERALAAGLKTSARSIIAGGLL